VNGPQNFREADLILSGNADPCSYGCPHSGCPHEMAMIGRAIGHGLLSAAAAVIAAANHRLDPAGRHEWLMATDPDYAAEQAAEATL
jgi:hypothetical protein